MLTIARRIFYLRVYDINISSRVKWGNMCCSWSPQNWLWQVWMLWQETYNTFNIFHFVTLWSNRTNQNFQRLFHFSTVIVNTKSIHTSIGHYLITIFQNDHWNCKILISYKDKFCQILQRQGSFWNIDNMRN
jgi:hypothetical protein